MTVFHTYKLGPVDHGWSELPTVREALVSLINSTGEIHDPEPERMVDEVKAFLAEWESAKKAAKENGWGGVYHFAPRVIHMPASELEFARAFVIKQDHNSTTFLMSPVRLPHLEVRAG